MKVKQLSHLDIMKLQIEVEKLKTTRGVSFAFSTLDKSDLDLQGGGYFFVDIDETAARNIWNVMEMSKDGPETAYNDIISSKEIKLHSVVYKSGGFFSSYYFLNAAICFDGYQRVQFGSIAASKIEIIIEKTRRLLTGDERFYPDTKEAIQNITY